MLWGSRSGTCYERKLPIRLAFGRQKTPPASQMEGRCCCLRRFLRLKLSENGTEFRVLCHVLGNGIEARGVGLEPVPAGSPAEHDGDIGVDKAFLVAEEILISLRGFFHLEPHLFSGFICGCAQLFAALLGAYPAFGVISVEESRIDRGYKVDGPAEIMGECGIVGRWNEFAFVLRIEPLTDGKAFTDEFFACFKSWDLEEWVNLLIVAVSEFSPLQPLDSIG